MVDPESPFAVQQQVRAPSRRYLDGLAPLRPALHRYCCRLTGNVWDGEDLAQDALVRVFSLLGKIDVDLEKPRAYLIRTATHLWIDRIRRRARERDLVEGFVTALGAKDLEALRALCSEDLTVELVGGAELETFDGSRAFFEHAHLVLPQLGFGENPHWELVLYEGEPIVLGFRTLDGVEGINEVHRIEVSEGRITRVRRYCFCPDTLRLVGEHLGLTALDRPYRSPSA